jgi:hypothetical protein
MLQRLLGFFTSFTIKREVDAAWVAILVTVVFALGQRGQTHEQIKAANEQTRIANEQLALAQKEGQVKDGDITRLKQELQESRASQEIDRQRQAQLALTIQQLNATAAFHQQAMLAHKSGHSLQESQLIGTIRLLADAALTDQPDPKMNKFLLGHFAEIEKQMESRAAQDADYMFRHIRHGERVQRGLMELAALKLPPGEFNARAEAMRARIEQEFKGEVEAFRRNPKSVGEVFRVNGVK